jgi:hypothetical protein
LPTQAGLYKLSPTKGGGTVIQKLPSPSLWRTQPLPAAAQQPPTETSTLSAATTPAQRSASEPAAADSSSFNIFVGGKLHALSRARWRTLLHSGSSIGVPAEARLSTTIFVDVVELRGSGSHLHKLWMDESLVARTRQKQSLPLLQLVRCGGPGGSGVVAGAAASGDAQPHPFDKVSAIFDIDQTQATFRPAVAAPRLGEHQPPRQPALSHRPSSSIQNFAGF